MLGGMERSPTVARFGGTTWVGFLAVARWQRLRLGGDQSLEGTLEGFEKGAAPLLTKKGGFLLAKGVGGKKTY